MRDQKRSARFWPSFTFRFTTPGCGPACSAASSSPFSGSPVGNAAVDPEELPVVRLEVPHDLRGPIESSAVREELVPRGRRAGPCSSRCRTSAAAAPGPERECVLSCSDSFLRVRFEPEASDRPRPPVTAGQQDEPDRQPQHDQARGMRERVGDDRGRRRRRRRRARASRPAPSRCPDDGDRQRRDRERDRDAGHERAQRHVDAEGRQRRGGEADEGGVEERAPAQPARRRRGARARRVIAPNSTSTARALATSRSGDERAR